MVHTLIGIALAFVLSSSSLVIVLFRVSPLVSPEFALPFFFLSVLIAVSSLVALILIGVKMLIERKPDGWVYGGKMRRVVGTSLRQGIFAAVATCFIILLHLLGILNWWIAALTYAVFILIEAAIGR